MGRLVSNGDIGSKPRRCGHTDSFRPSVDGVRLVYADENGKRTLAVDLAEHDHRHLLLFRVDDDDAREIHPDEHDLHTQSPNSRAGDHNPATRPTGP